MGEFHIVPYDGDTALISDEVLKIANECLQDNDDTDNELYTQPRHVEIMGDFVLVEGADDIPFWTIALPHDTYEELGYDGIATYNRGVFLPRPETVEQFDHVHP